MPDRAVVDERQEAYETVERHLKSVMAVNDIGAASLYGEPTYADPDEVMQWEQVLRELEPSDRALVALSEDRQWLVVLEPERWSGFGVYRREWMSGTFATSGYWHWVRAKRGYAEDTGQGADDVLAAWLEGRHEG